MKAYPKSFLSNFWGADQRMEAFLLKVCLFKSIAISVQRQPISPIYHLFQLCT